MSNANTKDKILEVANELFSEKGYGGTSIRDIAKLAEVNVASINYYFSNKENLFLSICRNNRSHFDNELKKIHLSNPDMGVEEFAVAAFDLFHDNSSGVVSVFKMMIDGTFTNIDISTFELRPLGATYFKCLIKRELTVEVSDETLEWAAEQIFTKMIHITLFTGTNYAKQCQIVYQDMYNKTYFQNTVRITVRSIVEFLNNNPKSWDELNK